MFANRVDAQGATFSSFTLSLISPIIKTTLHKSSGIEGGDHLLSGKLICSNQLPIVVREFLPHGGAKIEFWEGFSTLGITVFACLPSNCYSWVLHNSLCGLLR